MITIIELGILAMHKARLYMINVIRAMKYDFFFKTL